MICLPVRFIHFITLSEWWCSCKFNGDEVSYSFKWIGRGCWSSGCLP